MNENFIIDLKRKDQKKKKKKKSSSWYETKIIIHINKKLSALNKLYGKYDIVNHEFHRYFVTEIISVKRDYDSTYLLFLTGFKRKKCKRLSQTKF